MTTDLATNSTGLANAPKPQGAMIEVASARAAQEVQAAMIVARKFPRDMIAASNRIITACKRKSLASVAMYTYPRGDQQVTGPSIRLAEMLAQNWGNMDFGIVELEQRDGESTVMAFAWDLETNSRQTKIFQVPHVRHTRARQYALTDPRDIYELVANQGARRLRACILGIIPGDIVEAAVEQCERTLTDTSGQAPLIDRIRQMVTAFDEFQVTQPMIEKLLGYGADKINERDLIRLRKIYTSLRDGVTDREEHFDVNAGDNRNASEVETKLNASRPQQQTPPAPVAPPAPQAPAPQAAPVVAQPVAAPVAQPVPTPSVPVPVAQEPAAAAPVAQQQQTAPAAAQADSQIDPSVMTDRDLAIKAASGDWVAAYPILISIAIDQMGLAEAEAKRRIDWHLVKVGAKVKGLTVAGRRRMINALFDKKLDTDGKILE